MKRRVSINIVANTDIEKDDEIIVNYSLGYWKNMDIFLTNGLKIKPIKDFERDNRAKKRASFDSIDSHQQIRKEKKLL